MERYRGGEVRDTGAASGKTVVPRKAMRYCRVYGSASHSFGFGRRRNKTSTAAR